MAEQQQPARVFYSYSHKDATLRDELETHLAALKRSGVILGWSDRDITGGQEWAGQIDKNLESADIILLLVSADFINSDYCYDKEMGRALERHAAGTARIIPVIVRPVDWETTPFHKLQALPAGAKAVTTWPNRDEAWVDVVKGIRKTLESLKQEHLARHAAASTSPELERTALPPEQPSSSQKAALELGAGIDEGLGLWGESAREVTNDPAYANAIPSEMSRRFYGPRIFVYKGKTIVLGIRRTILGLSLESVIYNGTLVSSLSPLSGMFSKPVFGANHSHVRAVFRIFEGKPVEYVITDSGDLKSIALFRDGRMIFEDAT